MGNNTFGSGGDGGAGTATFRGSNGYLGNNIHLGGTAGTDGGNGGDGNLNIESGKYRASMMHLGGEGAAAGAGTYKQTGGVMAMYGFRKQAGNATFTLNQDGTTDSRAAFLYGTNDTGWQRWNVAADWIRDRYDEPSAILAVTGADAVADTNDYTSLDFTSITTNIGAASGTNGLGANSLTVIDGKYFVDSGKTAITFGAGQTIDSTAGMLVNADHGLKTGDTFTAVPGGTSQNWTEANISATSRLMTPSQDGTGKVTMTTTDKQAKMPGLSSEMSDYLGNMAATVGVHTYTTDMTSDSVSGKVGHKFLSRATDFRYVANGGDSAKIVESAARMAAIGAVPQMTWAAHNAAGTAVSQRTSLAAPGNDLRSMGVDGKAIDNANTGFAMWVMPLYQSWNGFGLEGGNLDLNINGGLGGVALGADYTFAQAVRAGLTFNMGGGYAEGSGDFNKTTNNMNFWGIGAYLGWTPRNFGLTADVNYSSTYNELEQDMPRYMEMGDLKSDIRAWALSASLHGEYKIETSVLDIIPHLTVRYTSLNTDEYDVEVRGEGRLYTGDAINQNIWTFPVGVTFSREIETNNGWRFKPSLDLAVIPAAGEIKAKNDVRFTGVPGAVELETQTMDYITYMGQAGLELGNDTVSVGVNLQPAGRSQYHGPRRVRHLPLRVLNQRL